uniref:Coatomer subunit epsilon n=1 Tax=Rhabditophanes sp. KR3021 TaxID=114890 RepID=A0AC35UIE9_9BILA
MANNTFFEIHNAYFLGNYQQCIQAAENLKCKDDEEKAERDSFMYRSFIAQGKHALVLSEIPQTTTNLTLKCLRRLAEYYNKPSEHATLMAKLDSEIKSADVSNENYCFLTSLIYINENDYENALRLLNNCSSMEGYATTIFVLLKIDRVDLAMKQLKILQEIDEDVTITQLALAWVNAAVGKEKLKDAFYIYQELMDKYGETVQLLVSQASCLIQQERYEEASTILVNAQQKDSDNAEVIINLLMLDSKLSGKANEKRGRLISQMKQFHAGHPWTIAYTAKETLFDRLCSESNA